MFTRQFEIAVATRGRDSVELTAQVSARVRESGVGVGLCHVFLQHTSASLMWCENADPDVRRDLEAFMQRLVPDADPLFVHRSEGPDDMPAHVRSVLVGTQLTLPVRDRQPALGTWQGVYLWEHRAQPHRRHVLVTVQGD